MFGSDHARKTFPTDFQQKQILNLYLFIFDTVNMYIQYIDKYIHKAILEVHKRGFIEVDNLY